MKNGLKVFTGVENCLSFHLASNLRTKPNLTLYKGFDRNFLFFLSFKKPKVTIYGNNFHNK